MSVNIFSISVVGYKNARKNKPSQDYLFHKTYDNYTLAVVCDGHSLEHFKNSRTGAKLACRAVDELLKNYKSIELLIDDLKNLSFQKRLKDTWRKLVYDDFYSKNYMAYKLEYISYGTTICFCVILDNYIVFFNLGDSSAFIKSRDKCYFVFKDNNYIYVNSLAHIDCEKKMQFEILKNDFDNLKIALFTDGYTNSFKSFEDLKKEVDYVFYNIEKDVFKSYDFSLKYKKYLEYLTKNRTFDDISTVFLSI